MFIIKGSYYMFSKYLDIYAGSLTPSYSYQVLMVAKYLNEMYEQYVNIEVSTIANVPKLILK